MPNPCCGPTPKELERCFENAASEANYPGQRRSRQIRKRKEIGYAELRALARLSGAEDLGGVLRGPIKIGITHHVPHVRDLVTGFGNGTMAARKVILVWIKACASALDVMAALEPGSEIQRFYRTWCGDMGGEVTSQMESCTLVTVTMSKVSVGIIATKPETRRGEPGWLCYVEQLCFWVKWEEGGEEWLVSSRDLGEGPRYKGRFDQGAPGWVCHLE